MPLDNSNYNDVARLGVQVRGLLLSLFQMVVDHEDDVSVSASVVTYAETASSKFNSPFGLYFVIWVHPEDIKQAMGGNKRSVLRGVRSVIVAVRGKNRVPIEMEVKELENIR